MVIEDVVRADVVKEKAELNRPIDGMAAATTRDRSEHIGISILGGHLHG